MPSPIPTINFQTRPYILVIALLDRPPRSRAHFTIMTHLDKTTFDGVDVPRLGSCDLHSICRPIGLRVLSLQRYTRTNRYFQRSHRCVLKRGLSPLLFVGSSNLLHKNDTTYIVSATFETKETMLSGKVASWLGAGGYIPTSAFLSLNI